MTMGHLSGSDLSGTGLLSTLIELTKYIFIMSAKGLNVVTSKLALTQEDKNKIIEFYSGIVSGSLLSEKQLEELIFLLFQNKPVEEDKIYMMYSHENKKGKPVSESEFEKYSEDKKDLFIWLDEKNYDLLIRGKKPTHVYPEERRALAYLIKNIGKKVEYYDLYLAMHHIREIPGEEWSNRYSEYLKDVHKCKSKIIEHCPEISRFITSISTFGYRLELPEEIKYCLIEELIKKIA